MATPKSIRFPEDLTETGTLVAKARGVSFNRLVVDSLAAEVERAKNDPEFMAQARSVVERNAEVLDRLAEQ
jgi:hypothetical protein